MLRYAIRRLLWTLPTLVGVSILSFLLLSYVPDPTDDPKFAEGNTPRAIDRLRRERFLDLPRFVNLAPVDVAIRAERAAQALAEDGADAPGARHELVRLGGAALPHVLPKLDTFPPEQRVRIALALSPIARRMGLVENGEIDDPLRVVSFWIRFWDDRGTEFRGASVRSAVNRLLRYGASAPADDIRELDTFALEEIFAALKSPDEISGVHRARVLMNLAADITGLDDRIGQDADVKSAQRAVERWSAFWNVHRSDFVVFRGPSRVAATLLETRYGKWALGAITTRFGRCSTGAPVLDEFTERAPVTLAVLFGAILLAYAAAIPLGAAAAARRGQRSDLVLACIVLGLYAVPVAFIAIVASRLTGTGPDRIATAAVVLAIGLVASPTRHQRSALTVVLSSGYVRAAMARGTSRSRAILVHGLRNALFPVLTLASLEGPMALGGAFVVERVFGLHGVGELTIRAVQTSDTSWLMAISIFAAGIAAVFVLATDLGYVAVDPRVASAVERGARS